MTYYELILRHLDYFNPFETFPLLNYRIHRMENSLEVNAVNYFVMRTQAQCSHSEKPHIKKFIFLLNLKLYCIF